MTSSKEQSTWQEWRVPTQTRKNILSRAIMSLSIQLNCMDSRYISLLITNHQFKRHLATRKVPELPCKRCWFTQKAITFCQRHIDSEESHAISFFLVKKSHPISWLRGCNAEFVLSTKSHNKNDNCFKV